MEPCPRPGSRTSCDKSAAPWAKPTTRVSYTGTSSRRTSWSASAAASTTLSRCSISGWWRAWRHRAKEPRQGQPSAARRSTWLPERLLEPALVDVRTDIYALGAVAYYLLSASPVFDPSGDLDLLYSIASEQPREPSVNCPRGDSPRARRAGAALSRQGSRPPAGVGIRDRRATRIDPRTSGRGPPRTPPAGGCGSIRGTSPEASSLGDDTRRPGGRQQFPCLHSRAEIRFSQKKPERKPEARATADSGNPHASRDHDQRHRGPRTASA